MPFLTPCMLSHLCSPDISVDTVQTACIPVSFACTHDLSCYAQSGRADEEDEGTEELQQALLVLLARLEALAVSAAAGELMPALAPALAQSLADVSGADAAPEDSAAVWECLSDLLCSPDAHAAQVKAHPELFQMCLLVALKTISPKSCKGLQGLLASCASFLVVGPFLKGQALRPNLPSKRQVHVPEGLVN